MFKKATLIHALPAVVLSSLLAVAIIYAWTEPSSAPPGGNVPPPLRSEPSSLNLAGATWSERNVISINQLTGYNDIYLRSNSSENATVYIAGSQLSFYSGGTEKWKIDSTGTLTIGSVPWPRLTSFPSACASGQYVSAVGSTLTCSTPAGGVGGSGTATQVAFFTAGTTIGSDSGLYWDNVNKRLGIGTTGPGATPANTGTRTATMQVREIIFYFLPVTVVITQAKLPNIRLR